MKKIYKYITRKVRPATDAARSASGSVTIVSSGGGSSVSDADPNSHRHPNLADLNRITTDGDGYEYLSTFDRETGDESPVKVKAGFADQAYDLTEDSPVRQQFLSRLLADTALGKITFAEGLEASRVAALNAGARFGSYVGSFSGAAVDAGGNGEFESVTSRSFLKVFELIYNRINALEGDTSFADSGTIESIDGGVATMRPRWQGDIQPFQIGDIVYGYVNDLLGLPAADGTRGHYKCWGMVTARTSGTITIWPYPDSQCPGGVNHPFEAGMLISRWGNAVAPSEAQHRNPDTSAFIVNKGGKWINTRQQSFYISCENGNIVQLMGVDRPVLRPENLGLVVGQIPAGLLPDETERVLNAGQPYLYARGIVVQDIIRIGYTGLRQKTMNYRGAWSAETASDPEHYYVNELDSYDAVTHNGCLWQCIATKTTDEPGAIADDGTPCGSWVKMSDAGRVRVWNILPTAQTVSVRYDGGTTRVEPQSIDCEVTVADEHGARTLPDNAALEALGARLYASADSAGWREFAIGAVGTIDVEGIDGHDGEPLETEDGHALSLGGDSIEAGALADRITFELRDTESGAVLARCEVPVIRDGKGERGQLVYPAGSFTEWERYDATGDTAPVVEDSGHYYILRQGRTWCSSVHPSSDYADNGDGSAWYMATQFNAVFADVVMAPFAKLGEAVFWGDKMFSQQGWDLATTNMQTGEHSPTYNYQGYAHGTFKPYVEMDFAQGSARFGNVAFSGGVMQVFGRYAKNIEIGVDDDGVAVMKFYDNDGNLLYDLGPSGIRGVVDCAEAWRPIWLARIADAAAQADDIAETSYKTVPFNEGNKRWKYSSAKVGGVVQDTEHDGRVYSGQAFGTPLDGWYCTASSAGAFTGYAEPEMVGEPTGDRRSTDIYRYVNGLLVERHHKVWNI